MTLKTVIFILVVGGASGIRAVSMHEHDKVCFHL